MRRAVVAVTVALLATGCSSSDAAPSGPTAPSAPVGTGPSGPTATAELSPIGTILVSERACTVDGLEEPIAAGPVTLKGSISPIRGLRHR